MARIVYVNGRYLPYAEAGVHVEDRGFQFADSVYEVCEVKNGALIDTTRHLARLARSLSELKIAFPMAEPALRHVLGQVVRRNRVRDGIVYLQVTRGQAPRDFLFPGPDTEPTLVAVARSIDPAKVAAKARHGHRCQKRARSSVGPLRSENGDAAARSTRQGDRPHGRGPGSVVRR